MSDTGGQTPHVLIVEGRFYDHIADRLLAGAKAVLEAHGATFEVVTVPGALEIPTAIALADASERFDAFVALGCVIRGETAHYDIVAGESARGLVALGIDRGCPIGNGILTVDTEAQALVRADPTGKDKGGDAARAALRLMQLAETFLVDG
ncbi:MAG: 6,7-dimethyl-8-ribityllumazine synthase [Geminicoccaceae bacterium]|nr:MAG: 6,7-dimethyl-8-ribityllumazine synthase [Geminicoccaceae bacterium]